MIHGGGANMESIIRINYIEGQSDEVTWGQGSQTGRGGGGFSSFVSEVKGKSRRPRDKKTLQVQ